MSSSNLEAALDYRHRNWMPVAVHAREKRPIGDGWQNLRLDDDDIPKHFNDGQNVGILLGEPSGGLVDVDLDCDETLALAPYFLPQTQSVFGRKSTQSSHWLYVADPLVLSAQFQFPESDGKTTMLVELRSRGGQTVFPPSTHPSGEAIAWEQDGEPAVVDGATLRTSVAHLAAAALLVRNWPKASGSRQDIALALAGGLSRAGWAEEDVADFIGAVAEAAGDEESAKRAKASKHTAQRLAQDLPATGWPRLAELLGDKVIEKVCEWLGVQRRAWNDHTPPDGSPSNQRPAATLAEAGEAGQNNRKPKWIAANEFLAEHSEDVDWLWHGYLAPGNVTMLSARPKAGKTTLVFHLLPALLSGRDFLGRATRPVRVLLMSEEPSNLIRRRLSGMKVDGLFLAKRSDMRNWDDTLAAAQDAIQSADVGLIVVDTLSAFWGIDQENEAGKVLAALEPLTRLAQTKQVAILLLHHLRKSPGSEGTASRGSSALVGVADIVMEIRQDEHAVRRRDLKSLSRYEETPRELLIELTDEGRYRALGKSSDVQTENVMHRALEAMPTEPPGKTQKELREESDPQPSTGALSKALERALVEGHAERTGGGKRGDPYRYRKAVENHRESLRLDGVDDGEPKSGLDDDEPDDVVEGEERETAANAIAVKGSIPSRDQQEVAMVSAGLR